MLPWGLGATFLGAAFLATTWHETDANMTMTGE